MAKSKTQKSIPAKYLLYGAGIILLIVLVISLNSNPQIQQSETRYVCSDGTRVSDSSFCPKQLQEEVVPQKNYQPFKVYMYMPQSDPPPGTLYYEWLTRQLSTSPDRQINFKLGDEVIHFGNDGSKETGYNSKLVLYSYTSNEETITCYTKEYYDGTLNEQFTRTLSPFYKTGLLGIDVNVFYEKNILPKTVRYDFECTGDKSNYKYMDSFKVNLIL